MTAMIQSSRWIEYDADNECIVGFNDDGIENNMIITGNSLSSFTKLSPITLPVELCGSATWSKRGKVKPMVNVQLPQSAFSPMFGNNDNNNNNNNNNYNFPISPAHAAMYGNYYNGKRTPSPISPQSPNNNNNNNNINNYINNNNCFPPMPAPSPYGPSLNGRQNQRQQQNTMMIEQNQQYWLEQQMRMKQMKMRHFIYQQHKREEEKKERERELAIAQMCFKEQYKTGTDKFDIKPKQKNLIFTTTEQGVALNASNADVVQRTDSKNGQNYETHGTEIVSQSYSWKFILHDKTNMIIGLIDADINGQQDMKIFFNTKENEIMRALYKNGRPEQGMVIEILYSVTKRDITIKNINPESPDRGIEYIFYEKIDVSKNYKLTLLLDEPGTVTMF